MSITDILPHLAGPAAAVVVLVGVLVAIYRLAQQIVVPLAQRGIIQHLEVVDRLDDNTRGTALLVQEVADDVERTAQAVGKLQRQHERQVAEVSAIRQDLLRLVERAPTTHE